MRILVVEDIVDVGEGIVACLRRLGHAVDWAQDGALADEMLVETAYDLAVLDLMLPEMDGVTVLKRMRARRNQTPVLVLTARSAIGDRVDGVGRHRLEAQRLLEEGARDGEGTAGHG